MSKVKLMLKNTDSQHWEGRGDREFSFLPRTGDLIEIEGNDAIHLYRVIAVVHSQISKTSNELYAVYIGETAEVLEELFKYTPAARSSGEMGTPIGFTPTNR